MNVRKFSRKVKPGRFSKNIQISNSVKILPVGAQFFHKKKNRRTDYGKTDMTIVIVAFRNSAKELKQKNAGFLVQHEFMALAVLYRTEYRCT